MNNNFTKHFCLSFCFRTSSSFFSRVLADTSTRNGSIILMCSLKGKRKKHPQTPKRGWGKRTVQFYSKQSTYCIYSTLMFHYIFFCSVVEWMLNVVVWIRSRLMSLEKEKDLQKLISTLLWYRNIKKFVVIQKYQELCCDTELSRTLFWYILYRNINYFLWYI